MNAMNCPVVFHRLIAKETNASLRKPRHAVCGGKTFAITIHHMGMLKGSNHMSQDKAHNFYFPLLGETQLFDWTANIPKLFSKNLHAQFQL